MLRFTKMHGLGNDFVMIDAVTQTVTLTPEQVRRLADRRFGVGCDQVLLVERALHAGTDFRYRIFNADGGEVEQCGNGARCFARFVRDQGLTTKSELAVETLAGTIYPKIEADGAVTVNMGVPRFEPREVPLRPARASRFTIWTSMARPCRSRCCLWAIRMPCKSWPTWSTRR
jgi:diaminopimelate epimerase